MERDRDTRKRYVIAVKALAWFGGSGVDNEVGFVRVGIKCFEFLALITSSKDADDLQISAAKTESM